MDIISQFLLFRVGVRVLRDCRWIYVLVFKCLLFHVNNVTDAFLEQVLSVLRYNVCFLELISAFDSFGVERLRMPVKSRSKPAPDPCPVLISSINYMRSLKRSRGSRRKEEHLRVGRKLLEKYGSRQEISRRCGIPAHSVCKAFRPKIPREQRKNKAAALRKAVADFYRRATNSMPLPDAKNAHKRYLTDTVRRTHEKFLKEFPNMRCSFAHFAKLRPWKTVKLAGSTPRRMCVCESCENASLMARCLSRAGVNGLELTVGGGLDQMWCSYTGRHPRFQCVQGACEKCGPHKLREKITIPNAMRSTVVKWKRWEKVVKSEVDLVKSGPVKEEVFEVVGKDAAGVPGAVDGKAKDVSEVVGVADTEVAEAGFSGAPEIVAGKKMTRKARKDDVVQTRSRSRAPRRSFVDPESARVAKSGVDEIAGENCADDVAQTRSRSRAPSRSFVEPETESCNPKKRRKLVEELSDASDFEIGSTASEMSEVSDDGKKRKNRKKQCRPKQKIPKEPKKQKKDRVDIVDKECTVAELFDLYVDEIWKLRFHQFLANWQLDQFHRFRIELRVGTILQVVDFSQNYLHVYQDEVTGAHWDHSQTTFFPCVNQFRCPDEKCQKLITLEQMFFSPSKDHSHCAVESFVARGLKELEDLGVEIGDIHRWSDNCGSQFKSKGPFFRMAKSKIPITLSFFGERHGKSLADGLGGRTKLAIRRARDRRGNVFQNASDLFKFCRENLQSPAEDFDKLREGMCGKHFAKSHFLQSYHLVEDHDFSLKVPAMGVVGTTKFHSVRSTGNPNFIETRDVSCTCLKCYYGRGQTCPNTQYTRQWAVKSFDNRRQPANFHNSHFPLADNDSLGALGRDIIGNMNDFTGEDPDTDCVVLLNRVPDCNVQVASRVENTSRRQFNTKPGQAACRRQPRRDSNLISVQEEDSVEGAAEECQRTDSVEDAAEDCRRQVQEDGSSTEVFRRQPPEVLFVGEEEESIYDDSDNGDDVIVLGGDTTDFAETTQPGWSDTFITGAVPATIVDADIHPEVVSDVSEDELFPPEAIDGRRVNWHLLYKELRRCRSFAELEAYSQQRQADLPVVPFTSASLNEATTQVDTFAAVPPDAPENRLPVHTGGDGNCLLRAVSLFIAGHEGLHLELRCRVTIELAANSGSYLLESNMARGVNNETSVVQQFAHYSPLWAPELSPREVFQRETLRFRLLKTYSGAWAIAALANILRRPVLSIYPLGLLRDLNRAFTTFSPRFRRREPVVIMWVDLGAAWHFVPLMVDLSFFHVCCSDNYSFVDV